MDLEVAYSINLKRLREGKGLSQGELSKILGVSQNTMSRIETAGTLPNKTLRKKIAKFFNVEGTDLSSHPDLLIAFNTFNKAKLK